MVPPYSAVPKCIVNGFERAKLQGDGEIIGSTAVPAMHRLNCSAIKVTLLSVHLWSISGVILSLPPDPAHHETWLCCAQYSILLFPLPQLRPRA